MGAHADVFGAYDPATGTWASASGWTATNLPSGNLTDRVELIGDTLAAGRTD
ncbi:MAG TPA: hypothetical protein VF526_06205 [Solirubrobacteraceae bacterium]